jgi:hypothetical protein
MDDDLPPFFKLSKVEQQLIAAFRAGNAWEILRILGQSQGARMAEESQPIVPVHIDPPAPKFGEIVTYQKDVIKTDVPGPKGQVFPDKEEQLIARLRKARGKK